MIAVVDASEGTVTLVEDTPKNRAIISLAKDEYKEQFKKSYQKVTAYPACDALEKLMDSGSRVTEITPCSFVVVVHTEF